MWDCDFNFWFLVLRFRAIAVFISFRGDLSDMC